MKAIVYTTYGPPELLEFKEVEKPAPRENQVLVRVSAASINALDYRRFESVSLSGRVMDEMVLKAINKVLGADIAGQVEAVGAAVTQFRPGDRVFGVAAGSVGGFAEYACAPETSLALKPDNISFEAAAAVPVAAVTALQGLRDSGRLQSGQQVLIHGASGGVGTFAVQIAKAFGADVTAVCSTRNLDMARAIGADQVIDYTKEDFTRSGRRYDLILAVNGNRSLQEYRRALRPNGRYVVIGGAMAQIMQGMLLGPLVSLFGSQKLGMMGIARVTQEDLAVLQKLLTDGAIVPVIDRSYPLSETAQAIRYLLQEHARGKVVISCGTE